jgi:hypothetical protein
VFPSRRGFVEVVSVTVLRHSVRVVHAVDVRDRDEESSMHACSFRL